MFANCVRTMYGRFKDDIVSAGRLEENSKKFFKGKTQAPQAKPF